MVLRELFVKLGLDLNEASFAKGQLAAGLLQAGIAKAVAVAGQLAHQFVDNVKHSIEYGNAIAKTSQSVGIATDALQELQYAGQLADLSAESMSQSIGILSRHMLEAKKGGEGAAKAFKGIAFMRDGKLMETEEVLGNIADRFASMPDGPEKTAIAIQLFGRAGKQMIPMLNKGSEDLRKLREEAHELGLVMGHEAIEASEELNDNIERLHLSADGLWRGAIAPLLPAMNDVIKMMLEWVKANSKLLRQKLGAFIHFTIKSIVALGEIMQTTWKILVGLYDGFVALWEFIGPYGRAALQAFAIVWAAVNAPILVTVAAIGALLLLLNSIRRWMEGKDSLFGDWMKGLDDWLSKKPGYVWFVEVMKDFSTAVKDALRYLKELEQWISEKWESTVGKVDRFVVGASKKVFGDASPLREYEREEGENPIARQRRIEREMQTEGVYGPYQTGRADMSIVKPTSGTNNTSVKAPVNIHVTQQPGENGPDFAQRVADIARNWWQGELDAARAVPR